MSELKLLPCPFCGVDLHGEIDDGARFHTHPKSDCWFSEYEFDQIDIEKWNRRTAPVGEVELPALPEPLRFAQWTGGEVFAYTAEQVRQAQLDAIAPYAERIRQLERELAERKTASIGDDSEFIRRLHSYRDAPTEARSLQERFKLIAYIDGRTAGAVPAWQPIETAPRDGRAVLLSRPDSGGSWIGKYEPVYQSGYRPDNPWFSLMLNHDYLPKPVKSSAPTHWMPIPAAPSPQHGKEGE